MDASSSYFSSLSDPMSFSNIAEDSQLLGLSLQDMIESDIKVDFDDIHCTNSFSGSFGTLESSDLFSDINFRIEDGLLAPLSPMTTAPTSRGNVSLWSTASNSYGYTRRDVSLMEDITGATGLLVNPINQMPVNKQPQEKLSQITLANANQQLQSVQQQSTFMQQSPQTASKSAGHGFSGVITTIPAMGKTVISSSSSSKPLKILPPLSSPLQQVPSPSRKRNASSRLISSNGINISVAGNTILNEGGYPKPAYSYSCLISLALKNSRTGSMSVSEIYKFMCEHFPYFKTAPSGWKNSVRHNLSLNKSFEKIEKPNPTGSQRKGCLWAMNPAKITKMDDEVAKWAKKDLIGIKRGMINPDSLELLEKGEMKRDYGSSVESEDEEDPRSPESVSSQDSQSDDQQGSELGDGEGFTAIQESALQELNLQISGGIFDELESSGSLPHGNYSISSVVHSTNEKKPYNLLVLHKQDGQKIFSI